MLRLRILLVLLFVLPFVPSFAQDLVLIRGKVKGQMGEPLEKVTIRLVGDRAFSTTTPDGKYELRTKRRPLIQLSVSFTGYKSQVVEVRPGRAAEVQRDIILKREIRELDAVSINSSKNRPANLTRIDPASLASFPGVSGNFESMLKTLPGVSTNNELSSQYSVRGGNFDENLIYINDVEIYRPLLVRNGQQEGLSFINPELVSLASFSAGGFDARYGDKLSSVLDVRYNKPDSAQTTLTAGLLGQSFSLKSPGKKGFLLLGLRNKTNQSILKTQPVVGSYQPKFYDFQALYNYDVSKKLNFSLWGDYNLSRFTLIPESRETTFGTINTQFKLHVDYEGQEKDRYESLAGAFTIGFKPSSKFYLKWISSAFKISEQETFDIEGSYVFDELNEDYKSSFGNVRTHRGIGTELHYGRNFMKSDIYSSELRAFFNHGKSWWEGGLRFQRDNIKDKLSEYSLIDSAGYSMPSTPDLNLTDVVNAANNVSTNRITGFLQNTISVTNKLSLSAGVRANYNSYTQQLLISPRLSSSYRPNENFTWRLTAGSYNQPPFYREFRNFNGSLNASAKAQRSLHLLTGSDYYFTGLGTNMKFSTEFYYKKLSDLVPYKLENLRVRYFADQQAKGYAAGADFSLSGTFVEGLESSFRLSLMKTAEDIIGDSETIKDASGNMVTTYPGYLKRPTDQRINFSAFFQDRLFNSPTYKVHLTLLYGSALPAGPPNTQRFADDFKIPAYKRVDIGFSKNFLEGSTGLKLKPLSKSFEALILYAEVFNLLNINNTVSFLWLKDVNNTQFAIPNYLTGRQLNFKIIAKIKNR